MSRVSFPAGEADLPGAEMSVHDQKCYGQEPWPRSV